MENYLTGKLWPIHYKPKNNELLSSWLARLAIGHGMGFFQFCTYAVKSNKFVLAEREWARDCDRFASEKLIEILSEKTATPIDKIRATMLSVYESKLFEKHTDCSTLPWIIMLRVNTDQDHFKVTQGQQYCPKCLEEDQEPYFRLEWRLAIIVFCVRHKVMLLNQCPHCQAPIAYRKAITNSRIGTKIFGLTYCYNCGGDLRVVGNDSTYYEIKDEEIQFQKYILDGLTEGWINLHGVGYIYSLLFFNGLKALGSTLVCGKHSARIREAICKKYQIDNFQISPLPNMKKNIERLGILERRKLLSMLRILLKDWPNKFIDFCSQQNIGKSILYRYELDYMPFWYTSIIDRYLSRWRYHISKEELASIYNYRRRLMEGTFVSPNKSEPLKAITKSMKSVGKSQYYEPAEWPHLLIKANWGQKNYKQDGEKNRSLIPMRRMSEDIWFEIRGVLDRAYKLIKVRKTENDREIMNGLFYAICCSCPWQKIPIEDSLRTLTYNRYRKFKKNGYLPDLLVIGSRIYED